MTTTNDTAMDREGTGDAGTDLTDANPFGDLGGSRSIPPARNTRSGGIPTGGSRAMSSEEYKMNHAKRGIAIIINNEVFDAHVRMPKRTGTHVDAAGMKERYEALGFTVYQFDNVTVEHLSKIVSEASQTDHSDYDCFSMTILTHGEEGVLYMRDGTVVIDKVFEQFKGYNSPTLVGKPKLFFIQACRGTKLDDGVEVHDGPLDYDLPDFPSPRIPQEADILLAYSVVPGYFSWRNSTNGSWFMQALVRVLRDYGTTSDLLTMMTRVNKLVAYDFESNAQSREMSLKKQIPCITSMLTKDVFFRPKKPQNQ